MAKKSAFDNMMKSYNKAMKQERKRYGLPVNKKPYFWEKNLPKSKPYTPKAAKPIKMPKNPPKTNNQPVNNGCYIATCVYGSYDCPEVWTLRRFRDYTLDESFYGRLFIKCYDAVSPTVVKLFGKQTWFQNFWRKHLTNWVRRLNEKGVEYTEYIDKY